MTDYDRKAEILPASSQTVYRYWLAKGKTKRQAYDLACASFNDEQEYQRMKRKGAKR